MQFILNLWKRIRNFDYRELTTTQIVVGITGTIIALWLLAQVISFVVGVLNILAPIALLTLVLYFGYNWMQSRSEDIDEEAAKSKEEKVVEEALANYRASLAPNEALNTDIDTEAQIDVASEADVSNLVDNTQEQDEEEDNLVVKQIVNPETGFKEPDIARLIEREEQKLKEADKVNEDIMAQIEARRKRLQNKDN